MSVTDTSVNQLRDPPTNANADTNTANNYLICDQSGFKIRIDDGLRTQWDSLLVRDKDYDIRHPQLFIRARPEHHKGSHRPEQPDVFLDSTPASEGGTLGTILVLEDGTTQFIMEDGSFLAFE